MLRSTPFERSKSRICSGANRWRRMPRLLGRCITGKVVLVSGCRRFDRLRTLPPDRARCSPSRLVLMELSEFALVFDRAGTGRDCARACNLRVELVPLLGSVMHQHRNRNGDEELRRADGLSRGGLQACAAGRAQPDRGHPQQCGRHAAHGGSGAGGGGGNLRADFHRQGGAPDQRDGRQQAACPN